MSKKCNGWMREGVTEERALRTAGTASFGFVALSRLYAHVALIAFV